MNTANPLSQYFRQPAIYIRLPSQGRYYPPGTLDMPVTGEIPVYPMTAIDEITYRTPDALFNGSAVVSVIQSCLPAISDAWAVPAIDLDTILVAMRIASYGHEMDFGSICPACENENDYAIDLRTSLERMRAADYSEPIKVGDIEIYFKPMTYKNLADNNKIQFDEQKIFQNAQGADDLDPARITALGDALKRMTELTVAALAKSIVTIKTPTAMVTEPDFITEFMINCDRTLFGQIQNYIIEHKSQSELQPLQVKCHKCEHEYKQNITLDMTNFFGPAS